MRGILFYFVFPFLSPSFFFSMKIKMSSLLGFYSQSRNEDHCSMSLGTCSSSEDINLEIISHVHFKTWWKPQIWFIKKNCSKITIATKTFKCNMCVHVLPHSSTVDISMFFRFVYLSGKRCIFWYINAYFSDF